MTKGLTWLGLLPHDCTLIPPVNPRRSNPVRKINGKAGFGHASARRRKPSREYERLKKRAYRSVERNRLRVARYERGYRPRWWRRNLERNRRQHREYVQTWREAKRKSAA